MFTEKTIQSFSPLENSPEVIETIIKVVPDLIGGTTVYERTPGRTEKMRKKYSLLAEIDAGLPQHTLGHRKT